MSALGPSAVPADRSAPRHGALIVPVKAFTAAKVRLAAVLSPAARAELAQEMAGRVLRARGRLAAYVVCDDDGVREWAESEGAAVIWTPRQGLNGAVNHALGELAELGHERLMVAHADLPLVESLDHLVAGDGVTLVPDRRNDGTNVLVVPAGAGFRVSYGAGSFPRHQAEATRLGLMTTVLRDERLSWDVDVPDDLQGLSAPPRS